MSKIEKEEMIKRLGGKCLYCYKKNNLVLDHIKPKSKGGDDSPYNLQVLCIACNSSKGNGGWNFKKWIPQSMCKKCFFKWIPRKPRPKACPRCKRYDWNSKTKRFETISPSSRSDR